MILSVLNRNKNDNSDNKNANYNNSDNSDNFDNFDDLYNSDNFDNLYNSDNFDNFDDLYNSDNFDNMDNNFADSNSFNFNYDDDSGGSKDNGDSLNNYDDLLSNLNIFSRFNLNDLINNKNIYEDLENKYLNDTPTFINQKKEDKFNDFKVRLIRLVLDNRLFKINSSDELFKLFCVFLLFVLLIISLIAIFLSFELAMAVLLFLLLLVIFILYLPKIRKENDYASFSKDLPYALRQLSTELRAGKSLFDSLDSLVESDYGVLSMEFSRVLEEIKYGESTENAFLHLEKRVNSQALSRVIQEILASLRIGSNLSKSLNIIAEDINFDIRMKLKEYTEKLNAFLMIYTFIAILAPVIILTMLLAASVVIGDLVPGDLVLILYGVFFPMIIVFMAFSIKKLEPRI